MTLLRRLGFERLAWSLRRLHCPVPPEALVLEVGSGGNPYFRANVLLDAFEATRQRHWAPLVSDRPTVLGHAEKLPFRDKAFDFIIASHVLEHSTDPAAFLAELQRVGRAGYIEVPDAFMERVNPYLDHRLELTVRNGQLLITKKGSWKPDPTLVELYEDRAKRIVSGGTIPAHPFDFHVRFYWKDSVPAVILNPETDAAWTAPESSGPRRAPGLRARAQKVFLSLARAVLSQRTRNASIDLTALIACPDCGSSQFSEQDGLTCAGCHAKFPVKGRVISMFPSRASEAGS